MFLLLNSNVLQGLTHVNKVVYVCGRFCLQLIACLFTRVSPWQLLSKDTQIIREMQMKCGRLSDKMLAFRKIKAYLYRN